MPHAGPAFRRGDSKRGPIKANKAFLHVLQRESSVIDPMLCQPASQECLNTIGSDSLQKSPGIVQGEIKRAGERSLHSPLLETRPSRLTQPTPWTK